MAKNPQRYILVSPMAGDSTTQSNGFYINTIPKQLYTTTGNGTPSLCSSIVKRAFVVGVTLAFFSILLYVILRVSPMPRGSMTPLNGYSINPFPKPLHTSNGDDTANLNSTIWSALRNKQPRWMTSAVKNKIVGGGNESQLAHKLLDGLRGIEIGAGINNPFGLDTLNVDYSANETAFYQ